MRRQKSDAGQMQTNHKHDNEGGRTKEIQRLIGRSLRAAVDEEAMGETMARVDCDVLQADGGTRTASITGGWVALADAFDKLVAAGKLPASPIRQHIAAVSVGVARCCSTSSTERTLLPTPTATL